jgi:hypothetical protein
MKKRIFFCGTKQRRTKKKNSEKKREREREKIGTNSKKKALSLFSKSLCPSEGGPLPHSSPPKFLLSLSLSLGGEIGPIIVCASAGSLCLFFSVTTPAGEGAFLGERERGLLLNFSHERKAAGGKEHQQQRRRCLSVGVVK